MTDKTRPRIRFLGAVGTVTGSRYLVEAAGKRILVDCGLFQGYKQLRLRNRAAFPVPPGEIDEVVLTHAHLDHSGYVPLLVRNGYAGRVHCTPATRDLCSHLLPDAGFIQEKDAEFANRHGFSRHHPARPLYTRDEAVACLDRFSAHPFDQTLQLHPGIEVTFRHAGHIPGAAIVEMDIEGERLVFSGDLGSFDSATMPPPVSIERADWLLVESTYGNRLRDRTDPEDALTDIIGRTVERGGTVIIPAFAVGRTQVLLHHIHRIMKGGRIPEVPVHLDSPLAIKATRVFEAHPEDHRLSREEAAVACDLPEYVQEVERSRELDHDFSPKIIIAGSGMATGGRVLHHLKVYGPDARNTILFTGYQAGGTRGAAMVDGAEEVKIHGQYWPIRAEVANLEMLSAHADRDEILDWLGRFREPPRTTFIVHGEPDAADALRRKIEETLHWNVVIPELEHPEPLA